MGFYKKICIFYGCPLTSNVKKFREKLKNIPLMEETNYFITSNAVYLVIEQTKKIMNGELERNDIENGYVKMSELEKVCKLNKNDINPSTSELELFFKYLNALVKEDKKEEMFNKIGYYLIEYNFCTLDGDFTPTTTHVLTIDMTK